MTQISVDYDAGQKPDHSCKALLCALLERAILDAVKPIRIDKTTRKKSAEELKEEAISWLFYEDESKEDFSFLWVCDHLNLNPFWIRTIILRRMNLQ